MSRLCGRLLSGHLTWAKSRGVSGAFSWHERRYLGLIGRSWYSCVGRGWSGFIRRLSSWHCGWLVGRSVSGFVSWGARRLCCRLKGWRVGGNVSRGIRWRLGGHRSGLTSGSVGWLRGWANLVGRMGGILGTSR